jgi:alpha-glucosidase
MRLVDPGPIEFVETDGHSLYFKGQRGEHVRVSVLDHSLIRVQHYPDGAPRLDRTWMVVGADGDTPREGRHRDDLSPFARPRFEWMRDAGKLRVSTAGLHFQIDMRMAAIRWADSKDRSFAADVRAGAYLYDVAGQAVLHTMQRRENEHYYGFGEKAGALDKAGQRMRMGNVDALGYDAETSDPLYKHWPFYITFVPDLDVAYGLFYDNLAETIFDMGKEVDALRGGSCRTYQAQAGDLDYYLIFGPILEQVIERFAALTGRPALPPRWSLGYLGSTMSYTEAPDAQVQLQQFAELCAQHDIPCSMFHLSSGYTTNAAGKRCVFTWNRDRIPDPPALAEHFHRAGIRLAANIKPYLLKIHPQYNAVAEQGGFIQAADSDGPETARFWSGGAYEFDEGAHVDFTSAAGYSWWKTSVTEALLKVGIDAIWNDNNEFEGRDDAARCAGFGAPFPIGLGRPLQTLLMARASFEALQTYHPAERPFLLSRAGCPGIQRYAQTWTGDNATSWHTLRYNIPMGLGLSLSGMPNIGHDVGGFAGPRPDPELFVRWVQNGIFHPRFTIHSWNSDGTVNEPWMYPDMLPVVRAAIHLRYRLIPYLYSLLVEAARTGHPIIRPMVYHFPHDARCRTESFDFMVGPNLLVASVLEPGARTRPVYLPEGLDWYDFHTGQRYAGGQTIMADAPLERIPLFVPAGGIIPMSQTPNLGDDRRQVYSFPHAAIGHGTFTLIEDDGISRDGQREAVRLDIDTTFETITLGVNSEPGGSRLPAIEFVLPPHETRPTQMHRGENRWQDEHGWRHITGS